MIGLLLDEPTPSYAVGDVPSADLVLQLDTEHAWTAVESNFGTVTITGTEVTLTVPALDEAGIISVRLVVTDGTHIESVEPLRIVVENPDDGWLTLDQARIGWVDAPEDDVDLYEALVSARVACEEFAPAVDVVPEMYRKAQRLQAQSVWTASRATSGERVGDGEHSVTVWPLDWNVKQLLRPKTAIGGMF